MIPSLIANIAGGIIAIDLGAKGPNFSVVSACASGSHAIGEAFEMIKRGAADVIFAGGVSRGYPDWICRLFLDEGDEYQF